MHAPTRRGHPIWIGLLLAWLVLPTSALALESSFDPSRFRDEDEKTVESFAAFPASARHAALVAAGYPEELLEIQKIQQKSSDDFAALLDSEPREVQEQVWNLVRYPGLAKDLGSGGRKSRSDLARIAERYPAEDRDAIIEEGRERYPLWVQIYAFDLEVEQSFYALLSPLPKDVQTAFDDLTDHPELTSLLIDNMHMTTVLGAAYREDPEGVVARFDELHDEVVARRKEQERAWAEEVADPEAAEELEHAARTFAEEYRYDLEDGRPPARVHVTHSINIHPFPYWYGYPYWYDVAYWYPRPFWGHVGFHFGLGRGYVSVGLPSLLFLDWYHYSYAPRHRAGHFRGHHHHHNHYRHVRYYERHRPHFSAGHRRHHDSRARRAKYDSRRRHDIGTRRVSYRDQRFDRDARRRSTFGDRDRDGRRGSRVAGPGSRRIDREFRRDRGGRDRIASPDGRRRDRARESGDVRQDRRRDGGPDRVARPERRQRGDERDGRADRARRDRRDRGIARGGNGRPEGRDRSAGPDLRRGDRRDRADRGDARRRDAGERLNRGDRGRRDRGESANPNNRGRRDRGESANPDNRGRRDRGESADRNERGTRDRGESADRDERGTRDRGEARERRVDRPKERIARRDRGESRRTRVDRPRKLERPPTIERRDRPRADRETRKARQVRERKARVDRRSPSQRVDRPNRRADRPRGQQVRAERRSSKSIGRSDARRHGGGRSEARAGRRGSPQRAMRAPSGGSRKAGRGGGGNRGQGRRGGGRN